MAAKKTPQKKTQALAHIAMGKTGLVITSLEDAYRFGQYVVTTGMAPKGMTDPAQVVVAMQTGAELGLPPMRALSVVTVINGRTGVMGEAALALIKSHGVLKRGSSIERVFEGEGENTVCIARAHRKGERNPVEGRFSVQEAKRAGLWKKAGPWQDYPRRMLWWRAVSYLARDHFGDVLLGLPLAEEIRDIPARRGGPDEVDVTDRGSDEPISDPLLATPLVEETMEEPPELVDENSSPASSEPEPCGYTTEEGDCCMLNVHDEIVEHVFPAAEGQGDLL